MKWVNHKLLTGSLVFAITGNPIDAFIAAIGSIIPDAIEGLPNERNYNEWRRKHRQGSHWFVPYLITFLSFQSYTFLYPIPSSLKQIWVMMHGNITDIISVFTWIIALLAIGACLHIFEDALCGKVPGINRKEKFGIKVFFVGSWQEYAVVLPSSIILMISRLNIEKSF